MGSPIVVVGSSNTDMVVQSDHLPAPGETVLGGKFIMNPGGKGANQAVAASNLGGQVTLIARVGNDIFGKRSIEGFSKAGIVTDYIAIDEHTPSGVALIMVDHDGENSISVAPGANAKLSAYDIDKAKGSIDKASFLLIQLEIPIEVVEYTIESCQQAGTKVILNPAPAQGMSESLLSMVHILTPNETEAEILTGIKVDDEKSARKAAKELRSFGVQIVIITMGSDGAYILSKDQDVMIPSIKVRAIDTTAAGDTFNGALVVGLSEGMTLPEAVNFANKAAAISVTRMGAQGSAPQRSEIT